MGKVLRWVGRGLDNDEMDWEKLTWVGRGMDNGEMDG